MFDRLEAHRYLRVCRRKWWASSETHAPTSRTLPVVSSGQQTGSLSTRYLYCNPGNRSRNCEKSLIQFRGDLKTLASVFTATTASLPLFTEC